MLDEVHGSCITWVTVLVSSPRDAAYTWSAGLPARTQTSETSASHGAFGLFASIAICRGRGGYEHGMRWWRSVCIWLRNTQEKTAKTYLRVNDHRQQPPPAPAAA
jgi:hypothetical protein